MDSCRKGEAKVIGLDHIVLCARYVVILCLLYATALDKHLLQ